MPTLSFAEFIRKRRKDLGFKTQGSFAQATGLTSVTISKFETIAGLSKKMSYDSLNKMGTVLQVDLIEFIAAAQKDEVDPDLVCYPKASDAWRSSSSPLLQAMYETMSHGTELLKALLDLQAQLSFRVSKSSFLSLIQDSNAFEV